MNTISTWVLTFRKISIVAHLSMLSALLALDNGFWNGGRPNCSGLNSNNDLRTTVASVRCSGATISSGTITDAMPARQAARTPLGESSKTKHWNRQIIYHSSEPSDSTPSLHLFQLTFSDFGGSGNRWAATRNMSGAGFPCFTSGSVEPITLWSNKSNNFGWPDIFISAISLPELVAKQNGTPCSWRCSTKRSAPGNRSRLANRFRHSAENRSRNSLVVIGSPNSVTAILALICSVVPRIRIRTSRGYGFPWSLAMSRTIPS